MFDSKADERTVLECIRLLIGKCRSNFSADETQTRIYDSAVESINSELLALDAEKPKAGAWTEKYRVGQEVEIDREQGFSQNGKVSAVESDAVLDAVKGRLGEAESMLQSETKSANSLAEKITELQQRPDVGEVRLNNAWRAGFQLCRSYGDNHALFRGEEEERQWAKFFLEDQNRWVSHPQPVQAVSKEVENLVAAVRACFKMIQETYSPKVKYTAETQAMADALAAFDKARGEG